MSPTVFPSKDYNGPVRSLVGTCGAVDYWCPGCGSSDLHEDGKGDIVCGSCGRAFRPIMFGPLPENDHLYDIFLDGRKVGQSRNDRGETSEGLWYAAMDSEMNDGTFTDLARKYYGHEPTDDEMLAFATSVVSSFDLRGYPDMLDVGECAVLPDGIPLKVVRVENMKSRGRK